MSRTVANLLVSLVKSSTQWMHPYRRAVTRALVAEAVSPAIASPAGGTEILFCAPSGRALHDAWDLYKGEPETIRWIDSLPANEVLWDIGANVGVYALYAAKVRGMNVLAFEPGAASYGAFVRNIELNGMDDKIEAYNLAFDETSKLDKLYMANTGAGHSMHAFGQTHSIEGEIKTVFKQATLGFSVDDFVAFFHPALPDHVKLDVDSIELKILHGAKKTLADHVQSLLIEIDGLNQGKTGNEIFSFLESLGFEEDKIFSALPKERNTLFRKKKA